MEDNSNRNDAEKRVRDQVAGKRLRQIREGSGLTLERVVHHIRDMLADRDPAAKRQGFDIGQLSRIENGTGPHPERQTIARILAVYNLSYRERKEILELYGYTLRVSLPTEEDIAWARRVAHPHLHSIPYPAYLVDCAHGFHDWNRSALRLIDLRQDDLTAEQVAELKQLSVMDLAFNTTFPSSFRIDNPDEFLPQMIALMKYELQPFEGEPWLAERLAKWCKIGRFSRYWDATPADLPQEVAFRSMGPIHLDVSEEVGILKFHLWGIDFIHDPRFRMVQFIPTDVKTLRQCAAWAEEDPPDVPST